MAGHPFCDPRGGVFGKYLGDDDRVISNDRRARQRDIGLRRIRLLRLQRVTNEETVERGFAASKIVDGVLAPQLFNARVLRQLSGFVEDRRLVEQPFETSASSRRRVERGDESAPVDLAQREDAPVREPLLRRAERALEHEFAYRAIFRARRRLQRRLRGGRQAQIELLGAGGGFAHIRETSTASPTLS